MDIIPIVIGLTQLVKQQNFFDTKYLPLASIVIAIIIGSLQIYAPSFNESFMQWIIWGLTATGLYGASGDIVRKVGNTKK